LKKILVGLDLNAEILLCDDLDMEDAADIDGLKSF
jgi:hypothetical protein